MTRAVARLWVERTLTVLAIASLWPWIMGWPHPVWRILMFVMLAAMVVLFLINCIRLWRLGHPKPDDPQ